MSPLPAFLLVLTCAATGWWLGLPAPAAPERPATRMATGGKPDAVQEAARHYLRVCALRERRPRDFAGEWAENLDRKGLIATWAAEDPDGFLDWFAREGWEQWGWLDAEFTAVFRGHEEWLFQMIPRLPLDKQDSYCSTAFQLILILSLPPAEAAALLVRYADALDPRGSSGIRGADSPELLEALSAALPPGPARPALLYQLARSVASAHPAEAGAWWQRQDAATRAVTAGAVLAGYPAGKPSPWEDATLTALMEQTLRSTSPDSAGELMSGWVGFLAKTDPAGALRWAAETLPVDSFEAATGPAWKAWLEQSPSPDALAALLADLPARDLSVLSAHVPEDPAVLTGVILPLLQQDPGSPGYQFAADSLRSFGGEGQAAIVEWIESAPPDAVPASLLTTAAEGKIDVTDPSSWGTALHWLASLDGQPIQPAAQSVTLGWFARRPTEAAAALSTEPPGPVRHAGIVGAARWLTDDPAAAGDWLARLPATDRPSVLAALSQSRLSPAAQEGIRSRLGTP